MEHDAQWSGVHIHYQMCGHGSERRSAGHPVDGFCTETNTLFQFHACLWHCCPRCFPGRRKEVFAFEKIEQGKKGLTREMQFARTLERRQAIIDEGFELVECWEHDFKRRQLYPTFPHIIVFDFESVLDTSKRKQATKCRCPFCWQTLWIERQSKSAAKIPKSGAGDSGRRLSVGTRPSEKTCGDTFGRISNFCRSSNKSVFLVVFSNPRFGFQNRVL